MKQHPRQITGNAPGGQRLPATRCVFCAQPLQATGGRRMVAQHNLAVVLAEGPRGGGNLKVPERVWPLAEGRDAKLLLRGEPNRWNKSAMERARQDALAGWQPWFCQSCAGRVCSICGTPSVYPMGADVIDEQGRITHLAIFPFNPGCANPHCARYKNKDQNL